MSEVIVEHPVLFVETLLKKGIGEEDRLLYLRDALMKGKEIPDSDKKYLKKMQAKFFNETNPEPENLEIKREDDLEIQKIEDLLQELKKSDSKLKDNLGLLQISHIAYSESGDKNQKSISLLSSSIKNNNSKFRNLIKKNFNF